MHKLQNICVITEPVFPIIAKEYYFIGKYDTLMVIDTLEVVTAINNNWHGFI